MGLRRAASCGWRIRILSELISERIGDGWLTNLEELARLEDYVDDADFRRAWRDMKKANKEQLADLHRRPLRIEPSTRIRCSTSWSSGCMNTNGSS